MIDYKDIIINYLTKHNWTIGIMESHSNGIITNALLLDHQLDRLFKGAMIFKNPESINLFLKNNRHSEIDPNQVWSTDLHNYLSEAASEYFAADLVINFVHFDQEKTKQLVFSLIIKDRIIVHNVDLSKYQSDKYLQPVCILVLKKLVEELVDYRENDY
ncbi:hypothetical protein GCW_01405 [Mycoplasmoides gallisepticum S6]|uniref:Uncharacterized protein n=1 Tax=Mycoplasmoides gallisepticum S6 TaxID=1006581 RepID=A0A0F6CKC3_MYCGL|nr:hypothetical protein [Mycoplasmoides gallisepticum]AHB99545.1 hypothetical protein GCW_01405 [Mycoplasmoides gallisepticum S6]